MRKQVSTRVVNEKMANSMEIPEGTRFDGNLAQDPSGFPLVRGVRPSDEPIALVADGNRLYWDVDDSVVQDYPLYGRPFIHTILDCYTFLKDYYGQTYNITLPDVSYEDNWWNGSKDYYKNHIATAGFQVINPPLQVGDVIAMKVFSPVINHTAVYLGDGMIGHHMPEDASKQEKFRPAYLRMTAGYYRHEDLK